MDFPPFSNSLHSLPDRKDGDRVASVFRAFKFLCNFAYYSGCFPVRGIGLLKSFDEVSPVKKMSASYILSLSLGVFVKLCCYVFLPEPITLSIVDKSDEGGHRSITDIATRMVGFLLIQAFGLFSHFLVICRSIKFLPLAQLLEHYLTLYPTRRLRLFNSWTISSILSSLLPLLYMTFYAYRVYSDNHERILFPSMALFMGGSQSIPSWGYASMYFLAFALLEFSVAFFHIQILFPAFALSRCLSELVYDIEEKFKSPNIIRVVNPKMASKKVTSISWSIADTRSYNNTNFWSGLSSRYIEIEKIFVAFEEFVGPYLIVGLGYSVVATVCMIYVASMSIDIWTDPVFRALVIHGTISIASFRVSAVTTIGEMLKKKYAKLLKAAATKGDRMTTLLEKDELDNFIRLVKALPLKLSAAGYFTVGRKNVTSIISVIITYFIVLQQFKMSEN